MAMLHKFNPVRLAYIRDQVATHFGREPETDRLLVRASHPRYRLRRRHPVGAAGPARRAGGRAPTRPSPISRWPASMPAQVDLRIDYRAATAEALADKNERFDVVLALEVVEHVADVDLFVKRRARDGAAERHDDRRHPQRTLKSLALANVGAEYVLRWLPRGTHRWDKFVTPGRTGSRAEEQAGLGVVDERGVVYTRDGPTAGQLVRPTWTCNYMLTRRVTAAAARIRSQ